MVWTAWVDRKKQIIKSWRTRCNVKRRQHAENHCRFTAILWFINYFATEQDDQKSDFSGQVKMTEWNIITLRTILVERPLLHAVENKAVVETIYWIPSRGHWNWSKLNQSYIAAFVEHLPYHLLKHFGLHKTRPYINVKRIAPSTTVMATATHLTQHTALSSCWPRCPKSARCSF